MFKNIDTQEIYKLICSWLGSKSVGGCSTKSDFKYYQEKLWNPILEIIEKLNKKKVLTIEEQEFINLVVYNGRIFRVLSYNPRAKTYICEIQDYQSWSKSIEGILNVPGIHGDIILIVGQADIGIDIFGLLGFLVKYRYIYNPQGFHSFESLLRYEREEEIVYKTLFNNFEKVVVVNSKELKEYDKNIKREIEKELWGRKDFR